MAAHCPLGALGQRANLKQYTHTHTQKKGKAEELLVENLQIFRLVSRRYFYVTFLTVTRNA